jgi:2-succinyl-5-enolpyruvyl-6-hydroxy-3-cyclohexene-1-carboxylate synthase
MPPLDYRNSNTLWCSVLAETWARCGLRLVVISPGSRSTPLTMAFVAHPEIEVIPVIDERSAAFFALGHARQTKSPVVLVCTSGSAGAHYLPALIEAHESGVSLIALTADRPAEMRDCAAGQTIDQHRLFGRFVSWYHEFSVPEPTLARLAYLRQTARQAWDRVASGPIHLNAPFRDPLPPLPDRGEAAECGKQIDEAWFAQPPAPTRSSSRLRLQQRVTTTRGVIIAGPAQPEDPAAYAAHIISVARATGWPVLADVLSPVRQYATTEVTIVTGYDLILRNDSRARDLTPRFVLALEAWPTSKVLREWLERSQAEMLMISPLEGNRDAVHGRTREITAEVTAFEVSGSAPADPSFRSAWQDAETESRAKIDGWMMNRGEGVFEGRIAWLLAKKLPDRALLCVANSMPVRDLDYFWGPSNRGLVVSFSRGANGIDGTLSTALGAAHRADRPVFLLTGDLAFLHDSNGLMLAGEIQGGLTVILINNSGGGIFEHLPVAQFNPPFERYFATPQSVDFAALCAAHGLAHRAVNDFEEWESAWSEPQGSVVRVIEVRTDRRKDAATRKRLFREFA